MPEQLKPCPFCGGDAEVHFRLPPCAVVVCLRCGAHGGQAYVKPNAIGRKRLGGGVEHDDARQRAIAAWNRRAGDA